MVPVEETETETLEPDDEGERLEPILEEAHQAAMAEAQDLQPAAERRGRFADAAAHLHRGTPASGYIADLRGSLLRPEEGRIQLRDTGTLSSEMQRRIDQHRSRQAANL